MTSILKLSLLPFLIVANLFPPAVAYTKRIDSGGLPTAPSVQERTDLIHQGDLIDVDVVGSTDFDWRGGIDPDGFLSAFRFADDGIFARCQSTDAVAEAVRKAYSKFLKNPTIRVSILDRSGRSPATVFGAVRTPQRFKLLRVVDLREILVLAGGIADTASGEIEILRQPSASCADFGTVDPADIVKVGDSVNLTLKISDLIAGKIDADPEILFGDIVTVTESPPVFVMGGVGSPTRLAFREGLSVARAVASAGGIDKKGDASRITVFRRKGGGSKVIHADLNKIESGAEPDIDLAAYDIVDVAQKGASDRRFAPFPEGEIKKSGPEDLPIRVID